MIDTTVCDRARYRYGHWCRRLCRIYLVRHLQQAGYRVHAVDRTLNEEASYLIDEGVSFTALDVAKEEEFDRLPRHR